MKIKLGKHEVCVTNSDLVMYNDVCYQLTTQKVYKGMGRLGVSEYGYPIVSKVLAQKLIKEGTLVKIKNDVLKSVTFYRFNLKEEDKNDSN